MFLVFAWLAAAPAFAQAPSALSDSAFAAMVARMSETPGYFDTDNLISNEDSYLHVLGALKREGVSGGAYIGVGPDQNYSYITAIRPHVAFIVDIRRDNLLEHVWYKALFAMSRSRLEFLCLMFGRSPPSDTTGWGARDIASLFAYIDAAPRDSATVARARQRVMDAVRHGALPMSPEDVAHIARMHAAFINSGPALRFNSYGRAPAPYYPDFRRLAMETDRAGRQSSFLAHEADFQYVKSMHARNLIVPIVGDFAGDKALASIAQWLRVNHETVSAFYTSNVEQYLFRDGGFAQFAKSVAQMPRNERSVMIRSYFLGYHPQQVTGYHATQLAQLMSAFVGREWRSY